MQLAIVAAGFTPGEADQLRRSMASWQRSGSLEQFRSRLFAGMEHRGYSKQFAKQIYDQISGFGEYGFPESHSASFALLSYVSSWLKYYEPAAFLAGLLNSQPMGFYSPSVLVQDAQRHGVTVRAVDATVSDWECTLERSDARLDAAPAVRLGLRMIKGLSQAAGLRIEAARRARPFDNVTDLARRAALNRGELSRLAAAGALAPLAGHRRNAHWLAAGAGRTTALLEDAPVQENLPGLAPPRESDDVVADYAAVGLTLGRHPLALLRRHLAGMRLSTAAELKQLANGRPARVAGIVTCRQRPGTASGIVFVTLEDETGYINVVVWKSLVERQRRELLGARLLGVEGVLQKDGEVVHLVAHRLVDHTRLLGELTLKSRDFH